MKTNYQAVVAEYHVEEESSDLDLEDEEKEGLVSNAKPSKWSRHQSHHLWGESHQSFAMNAISSSDSDEDVARAREELDGLRRPTRPFNPLTIIQVKNAERNLDSRDGEASNATSWLCYSTSSFDYSYRPLRRLLLTSFLVLGVLMIGLSLRAHLPSNCPANSASACHRDSPSAEAQSRLRRETRWTKIYESITLTSGLEVVETKEEADSMVVSGFSNSSYFGILALRPEDGAELWRQELEAKPLKHDCNLVDVNNDGLKDCIVVGERGMLAAIDPQTGKTIWNLRYHMPLVNISLPRQLPDLDGDNVSELVSSCAVTFPSEIGDNHVHLRTNFILISGGKGRLLGRPYLVETCTDIGAINVTSNLALQFDCTSQRGPDEFEMSLDEFYMKSTNHAPPSSAFNSNPHGDDGDEKNNVSNAAKYRQFDVIGEDSPATVKDSIHLDWSPLNPDSPEAGVTVKMWDSFAHRLLWQQTWPRAVAFQPLSTRYETNRPDSPIEGFLFRIWQWKSDVRDTFTAAREKRAKDTTTEMPTTRKSTKNEEDEEDEEEEDLRTFYNPDSTEEETSDNTRYQPPYEVVISSLLPFSRPNLRGLLSYSPKKSSSSGGQFNRLVSHSGQKKVSRSRKPPLKSSIRRVLNVTETLFYATLNHSSPQVIALFAHDIMQECLQRTPFMPYQCQPHYDTMPNSMVILEHSPDGPDWRDVVFASRTWLGLKNHPDPRHDRILTSLHSLKLSKDISQVTPVN